MFQVVGQFNLGFIIGKLDQDLFIVDQVNFSSLLHQRKFTLFYINELQCPDYVGINFTDNADGSSVVWNLIIILAVAILT